MSRDHRTIFSAIKRSWSRASASQWTAEKPAAGQCKVTALLVHELCGGDILKTSLPDGDHFYNRIDGRRVDLTESQFDRPIAYADIASSREDAERGIAPGELAALRSAFRAHMNGSG